jgi:hypothetical protein
MSCLLHPLWCDHLKIIWWRVQIMKILICNFLQPPVTSSLLDPNILTTLFSLTPSICVLPLTW